MSSKTIIAQLSKMTASASKIESNLLSVVSSLENKSMESNDWEEDEAREIAFRVDWREIDNARDKIGWLNEEYVQAEFEYVQSFSYSENDELVSKALKELREAIDKANKLSDLALSSLISTQQK